MENAEGLNLAALVVIVSAGVVMLIMAFIILMLINERKIKQRDAKILEQKNSYDKNLLVATLEIAEEEKMKLARNIHDDIGIMLYVLKNQIIMARRNAEKKTKLFEALDLAEKTIEETIGTIRSISGDQVPGPLMYVGFVGGLKYLCEQVNANHPVSISLYSDTENIQLEQKESIHLYLIVKEIVNNIIKHTKASEIKIDFRGYKRINIDITHNGIGISNETIIDKSKSSKGIGLRSIMGRAQLIDANIEYFITDQSTGKVIIEKSLMENSIPVNP